jgi:hypothetical protein
VRGEVSIKHPTPKLHYLYFISDILIVSYVLSMRSPLEGVARRGGAAAAATTDVAAPAISEQPTRSSLALALVSLFSMCLVTRFKMRDGHYEVGPGAFFDWLREGCPKREECAPTPTRTPRSSTVGSAGAPGRDSIEDMRAYLDMNMHDKHNTGAPVAVETEDMDTSGRK